MVERIKSRRIRDSILVTAWVARSGAQTKEHVRESFGSTNRQGSSSSCTRNEVN